MAEPETKKVSLRWGIGIFFMPYIFAWGLLRDGYSRKARVIGLGWLGLFALSYAFSGKHPNAGDSSGVAQPAFVAADPDTAASSLAASLTQVASSPEVDPAEERAKNKTQIAEIEKRLADNKAKLKKFYAQPSSIKQGSNDILTLTSIAVSRGLSKNNEDLKQAKQAKALAAQVGEQVREMYASSMEQAFVKNGMDCSVAAEGRGKEKLTVSYALMSQPMVYKFQNEMELPEKAKGLGFKRIVYTNGFESSLGRSWTVDL